MKAEELRIGNLVTLSGSLILTVYEIHEDCFYAKDIKEGSFKNTWSDLQPIQLSEEVLLKCGFENGGYDLLFWYNNDIELYGFNHLDADNYALLTSHLKEDVNVRIYYLHQLQNLYYALTGEELEVSLLF